MAKAPPRRGPEETLKMNQAVDKLVASGSTIEDACKKLGATRSAYSRYKHKMGNGSTGSMSVSMLPPRPLGNGKNKGRRGAVNMKDVASVAKRISTLDVRLGKFNDMRSERQQLAEHLMTLLKA